MCVVENVEVVSTDITMHRRDEYGKADQQANTRKPDPPSEFHPNLLRACRKVELSRGEERRRKGSERERGDGKRERERGDSNREREREREREQRQRRGGGGDMGYKQSSRGERDKINQVRGCARSEQTNTHHVRKRVQNRRDIPDDTAQHMELERIVKWEQ